ncbi:metallophosphoesterase family protein [Umezakia ovalisporum]|jgi:serine/threonine protein phosphatase 1|uniref:Serine/threonine protein phosphatase n=2 Tax=Umezakia ovalisporum TaxID=75695 RepID=A0AA43KE97_9CYAN|nr:metallophosphoesterase family protein [Umezakia ovalisporum]MBI1242782.1 serine/threonine protein phosphatase [Nostoc sp. RI_552]MDH6055713.1 serine/threonine protein phosphatase [Umezakia ovalisporum FSS-43]MDH6062773.1 serine/threonine protein phosphatase [Umezakia ovalisporum FSS-62]MDH6067270.1 serine/threonine protein phosphatase [Umezakia ovalisporum APH033B]MDH6069758.1 serine/threonine protein phosphatase [Umezakia ovalisporum CobakiLakeA]
MRETSQRQIIIGDVHGHYEGLMRLMDLIAPASDDQVYFLGDLIDRGPKSSQVIDFVKNNNYPCLLGNHEQMLLSILSGDNISTQAMQAWLYGGGQATIASYKNAHVPKEHLDWLRTLPTYLDLGHVWLTHAGVDPYLPLAQQTAEQFCWIRHEFHSIQQPYFIDKLMIIGHTITFTFPGVSPGQLAQGRGWLDIDTGAYHPRSGWLTALDITNNLIYQVNMFNDCLQTLPLAEGVVMIDPSKIAARRHKQRA